MANQEELLNEIATLRGALGTLRDQHARLQAVEQQLLRYRARLIEQQSFLARFAQVRIDPEADAAATLREITAQACRLLNVDRVSVWHLDPGGGALECLQMFECTSGRHVRSTRRREEDCRAYFEALRRGDVLGIEDARSDPRTAALATGPRGVVEIVALLHVPIMIGGTAYGVLCAEHTEGIRSWLPEDRLFALGLANALSLLFEQRQRAKAERALVDERAQTERVFDQLPDVVMRIDRDLKFLFVNEAARRYVGIDPRDMVGRFVAEASLAPNRLEVVINRLVGVFANAQPERIEFSITTDTGLAYFDSILIPEIGESEAAESVLMIARDITARVRSERALREREERFRMLLEISTDYYWEQDESFRYTVLEAPAGNAYALGTESIIGKQRWELGIEGVSQEQWAAHRATLEAHQPFRDFEVSLRGVDGALLHFQVSGVPVVDRKGRFRGYRGVTRNVTERRRADLALTVAKQTAEAANDAKSRFLAAMSHEIRTSMNAALGMLDVLQDSTLPEEQRELARSAYLAAETLLQLSNDLAEFSRLESGTLEIREEPFRIRAVVRQVIDLLEPRAEHKGVALRVSVEEHVPSHLLGDAGRIWQVLVNLVASAIRFSNRGSIAIRVARVRESAAGGERLRVSVADSGAAIPEEIRSLLANAVQGRAESPGSFPGLGLAVAGQLVRRMGAEIGLEAGMPPGAGIWFSLPLKHAAGQVAPPLERSHLTTESRLHGRKVLLVDDEPLNRSAISIMLGEFGCDVITAENGRQAVQAIEPGQFDLVLMDCRMPVLDGFGATAAIREIERVRGPLAPEGARLPIIAFTASLLSDDRERALAAGFDDYLTKPLRRTTLRDVLDRFLAPSETPRESR